MTAWPDVPSPESSAPGMSIRARIALLAGVVLLPAALALGWRLADEIQQSRDDALVTVSLVRDDVAERVAWTLDHATKLLAHVAREPEVQAVDLAACRSAIRAVPLLQPSFMRLELRDAAGRLVCATSGEDGLLSFSDGGADPAPVDDPGALEPIVDPATGRLVLPLSQAIVDASGRRRGELRMLLDLRSVSDDLARITGDDAVVSVIDRRMTILMRTRQGADFIGRRTSGWDPTAGRSAGFIEARGSDDVERLYAFSSIPATGWRVFAGMATDRVYAKYEAAVRRTVVLGSVVLLAVVALGWRLVAVIARPVAALQSAVRRVARGKFDSHIEVAGPPELQGVAQDFNRMVDALALSRSRLQALFDTMSEAVIAVDETQVVVTANPAAARLLGVPLPELVGSQLERWIPQRYRGSHREAHDAFIASDSPPRDMGQRPEVSALRADGVEIPVEASISSVRVQGQRFSLAVLRDVGERRKAMAAIAAGKALLAAALANMSDAVLILDAEGRFLATNDAFGTFFRLDEREPPPASIQELASRLEISFEDGRPVPEGRSAGEQAIAGESGSGVLYRLRRRGSDASWVGSFNFAPIRDHDGAITNAVVTARDVTAALAAQRELERSHGALRRLVNALDRSQDDERRRISRELHDDLQQTLAAIGIEASAVLRQMPPAAAALRPGLDRIDSLSRTALRSTRRIIADLRPQVLEELGLEAALRNMAAVHARHHEVPCEVEIAEDLETEQLPEALANCLYRVAQEALNNVAKHANAATVRIRLHQTSRDAIVLEVHDDGRGLPPGANAKPRAFGLLGMAERVHALQGRLRVSPGPDGGTVVEAELPLDPGSEDDEDAAAQA